MTVLQGQLANLRVQRRQVHGSGSPLPPKTSAARSSNCRFHSEIWFGCTSNCSHNWAIVRSSRNAASATRALNAGLWVRHVRRPDASFFIIRNSFSHDRCRSAFIPRVSTYSAVQIYGTTSLSNPFENPSLFCIGRIQALR